jgi:hypothetical protein
MGSRGLESSGLKAQGPVEGCEHGSEPSDFLKFMKFPYCFEQLLILKNSRELVILGLHAERKVTSKLGPLVNFMSSITFL